MFVDEAYTDCICEYLLAEVADIHRVASRKSNAKRVLDGCIAYICQHTRKRIETTFSQIAGKFGRYIRAVTPCCFELVYFLFVWHMAT